MLAEMSQENYRSLNKARAFFRRIGLPFVEEAATVQPPGEFQVGCWIEGGKLHYCPKTALVGSVLHEAGHLAVTPRQFWPVIQPGDLEGQAAVLCPFGVGGEFAAEAWGWAAAEAAGIPSSEAVIGSTGISGAEMSDAEWEDFNRSGYFLDMSKAQWKLWLSLHEKKHIGIAMLVAGGYIDRIATFPKCDRWFWHKRKKTPGLAGELLTTLADNNPIGIKELWQI